MSGGESSQVFFFFFGKNKEIEKLFSTGYVLFISALQSVDIASLAARAEKRCVGKKELKGRSRGVHCARGTR